MNGAREYAVLFRDTEVHGRLLIMSGKHARGREFHIWVMPEGGNPDHYGHAPDGSVEVYGILGGHPGWTEYYGWKHAGKWQSDFAEIVEKRRAEIDARKAERIKEEERINAERKISTQKALAAY